MRKIFIFSFAACVFAACFGPVVPADTIILKDGRKIEGIVIEEGNDAYTVKIKIGTMKLNKDTVREIKKSPAEENFLNLGNQYLASNNFEAAIEQYSKALQANANFQPAKDGLEKAEKLKAEAEAKRSNELKKKDRESSENKDKAKSGFGFTIQSYGNRIILANVASGGKAEAVGLKPKDEIIRINDMDTEGKSVDEITGYLAKSENTAFTFLVQRDYELTRKRIDYQKHSFVGVGIFLDVSGDNLVINSVIVGEPADLAGLKSKDKVVSIEGKPSSGMSVDDAANLIGGSESSKLKIVIRRSVELERK